MPEEENTPLGGGFGTLPSNEHLDAVFGDDPPEEPASPAEGEAQDTAQDTAQPAGESEAGITSGEASPQVDTDEAATSGDTDTAQDTEEPPEEPEGYSFAGRTYRTREEAERSYREMQGFVTRTRQEMTSLSQRMDERQRLQEEALAQLLNQASYDRAKQDPEYAAQVELAKQLQPLVDQRVGPMEARLQEALRSVEVERQKLKIDAALDPFFKAHPDVAEGTQENIELARTVYDLHESWSRQMGDNAEFLDMSDPAALELAYECYKDPDLLVVLQNKPQLADSDRGLDYARLEARQLKGSRGATAQGGTPPQKSGVKKVVGQPADVEVPGGKAPASRPPQDEWEEVLALEAEDAKHPNPFLGGRK